MERGHYRSDGSLHASERRQALDVARPPTCNAGGARTEGKPELNPPRRCKLTPTTRTQRLYTRIPHLTRSQDVVSLRRVPSEAQRKDTRNASRQNRTAATTVVPSSGGSPPPHALPSGQAQVAQLRRALWPRRLRSHGSRHGDDNGDHDSRTRTPTISGMPLH